MTDRIDLFKLLGDPKWWADSTRIIADDAQHEAKKAQCWVDEAKSIKLSEHAGQYRMTADQAQRMVDKAQSEADSSKSWAKKAKREAKKAQHEADEAK